MRFILLLAICCAPVFAQTGEVATQEESFTFKSRVNVVQVTVVVRDKKGQPVENLKKEDFRLFDRGKPQEISRFSVERPGSRKIPVVNIEADGTDAPARIVEAANQFIGYLFDDIHIKFENLVQTREALRKHLRAVSQPGARFALFTTSGQNTLAFTDDKDAVDAALMRLAPHPITSTSTQECPDVSFYAGNMVVNHNDQRLLGLFTTETMICMTIQDRNTAKTFAENAARRAVMAGEQETRVALLSINDAIRRMAAMPGERTLVMLSPGFLRLDDQLTEESSIIDRATRAGVVVNALDARGLYTDTPDITKHYMGAEIENEKSALNRQEARQSADIMAELADGTGGRFFENSNDYQGGIDKLSGAPQVYYVLSFSPQNLKLDGAYHALKVQVKEPVGLDVKARRGYYAPRHLSSADEESKEEISQALFSRDEMNDIPLDLHTQFFKTSDTEARLQVAARVDVRNLHFRKLEGTNSDDVAVVAVLFDRNGNYLQGVSKVLKMKLKDDTLQARVGSGITVRSDFKVSSGTYIIRLVIRDAEGQ